MGRDGSIYVPRRGQATNERMHLLTFESMRNLGVRNFSRMCRNSLSEASLSLGLHFSYPICDKPQEVLSHICWLRWRGSLIDDVHQDYQSDRRCTHLKGVNSSSVEKIELAPKLGRSYWHILVKTELSLIWFMPYELTRQNIVMWTTQLWGWMLATSTHALIPLYWSLIFLFGNMRSLLWRRRLALPHQHIGLRRKNVPRVYGFHLSCHYAIN